MHGSAAREEGAVLHFSSFSLCLLPSVSAVKVFGGENSMEPDKGIALFQVHFSVDLELVMFFHGVKKIRPRKQPAQNNFCGRVYFPGEWSQ